MKAKKKQLGFTLIEFGITMILVTVLIAIGIRGYQKYKRNIAVNENIQALTLISEATRAKYGTTVGYANLVTANAVANGVIPTEFHDTVGGTTASNKFDGAITLTPGANNTAQLTWDNVPQAVCANIITGVEAAFSRIQVDGVDVKPLGGLLDDDTLTAQCANEGNNFTLFIGKA